MTNNDELARKLKAAAQAVIDDDCWVAQPEYWDLLEPQVILSLLAERDADKKQLAQLISERDALREGAMGDAKHSNTRAAADIYFQLIEECDIPPGGSLVEHVDNMRQRIAELETVCAESYQVVVALADAAGVFETSEAVSKALDNLSDAKLTHDDVLPFVVEARTVSVKLQDVRMTVAESRRRNMTWRELGAYNEGAEVTAEKMVKVLTAAGINLEVEE